MIWNGCCNVSVWDLCGINQDIELKWEICDVLEFVGVLFIYLFLCE